MASKLLLKLGLSRYDSYKPCKYLVFWTTQCSLRIALVAAQLENCQLQWADSINGFKFDINVIKQMRALPC